MIKKTILALTICACFSQKIIAEEAQKKGFIKKMAQAISEKLCQGKKATVNFVKKHPFIATAVVIAVTNKSIRDQFITLPQTIFKGIQNHPYWAIILGGLALNCVVSHTG